MTSVDALLSLSDDELARACKFEPYKSGGPGGQKRNKTSSAMKVTHAASGISAFSSDFRSQTQNRIRALHRLRFKLAADLRTPIVREKYATPDWFVELRTDGKLTTNEKNRAYPRLAAHALDVLAACEGRAADTAVLLGVSTSNLIKFLQSENSVWSAAERIRSQHGLRRLVR